MSIMLKGEETPLMSNITSSIILMPPTRVTSHRYLARQLLVFITALYTLNNSIICQMWASFHQIT